MDFRAATWDEMVTHIPKAADSDPIARLWETAATARWVEIDARINSATASGAFCGPRLDDAEWNLRARAIRELGGQAAAILAETWPDLHVVHGPSRGSNARDLQVDLAQPEWVSPLATRAAFSSEQRDLIADINPFFDDELRVAARIQFQLDTSGGLQLQVGTFLVPYLHDLKKQKAAIQRLAQSSYGQADQLRKDLCAALTGRGLRCEYHSMSKSMWNKHCDLIDKHGWGDASRVRQSAAKINDIIPIVDSIF